MTPEMTQTRDSDVQSIDAATPSAEFITAISEFFQTDPNDLLVELGYYDRESDQTSA